MALTLGKLELEVLRKLVNGEAVSLSSQLRLRLEMAGVIREGAAGIAVTDAGRRLARQAPATIPAPGAAPDSTPARDKRGRRMPFQRKSIF
jgi:hypothetical protein